VGAVDADDAAVLVDADGEAAVPADVVAAVLDDFLLEQPATRASPTAMTAPAGASRLLRMRILSTRGWRDRMPPAGRLPA
jgi:hypothetical protein